MNFVHDPEIASEVVLAGVNKAKHLGLEMAIAIVDSAGNLVAFARTENASMAAVESVPAKARTAIWFGRPTSSTVEAAEKRPTVYTSGRSQVQLPPGTSYRSCLFSTSKGKFQICHS